MRVLDKKIETIRAHELAAVSDWAVELPQKLQPLMSQLDAESSIVGAFQQSGPKLAVHGDRAPDHLRRQPVEGIWYGDGSDVEGSRPEIHARHN